MMIEEKLMNAAINAEQRNNFYVASMYLQTHAKFVGADKLPDKPIGTASTTQEDYFEKYQVYYFALLALIGQKASETLKDVREKYGKKTNDIPKVVTK